MNSVTISGLVRPTVDQKQDWQSWVNEYTEDGCDPVSLAAYELWQKLVKLEQYKIIEENNKALQEMCMQAMIEQMERQNKEIR